MKSIRPNLRFPAGILVVSLVALLLRNLLYLHWDLKGAVSELLIVAAVLSSALILARRIILNRNQKI
jgi:hypothetical protein